MARTPEDTLHLALNDDQQQLRDMVRALLATRSPETAVRALAATEHGCDEELWNTFAELGLLGLAVPEEFGGAGCGLLEVGVVMEETGRALACVPYLSSVVLGTTTLLESGDETAMKDYLPAMVSGEHRAACAFSEDDLRAPDAVAPLQATEADGGWILNGTKDYVVDGASADVVIASAWVGDELRLFVVDGNARGLHATAFSVLDMTRKQASIAFDRTPARMLNVAGSAAPVIQNVLDVAAALLAMEQVGGASALLEMTVEYAKVRVQFGRVIGSFQAIKHRCADLLVGVESARAAAMGAVCAAVARDVEAPSLANVAKAFCSDVYMNTAAESIQVHGGIGFTWEHPAHLYFRRAKASQLMFGDPTYHRAQLADRLEL